MGEILKAQGQYAEAVAAYERALEHAPSKVNWRYNLALCLEALGEPEAVAGAKERLREDGTLGGGGGSRRAFHGD